MRLGPGRVVVLLGALFGGCSLFPDAAPLVSSSRDAGTGGSGNGGDSKAEAAPGGSHGKGGDASSGASAVSGGASGASADSSASGTGGRSDRDAAEAGDARPSDGRVTGDGSTSTVTYVASIADCLEAITQPAPGSCLAFTTTTDGPNELWVDIRRTQHRAFTTYLGFPVDSVLANHTIETVELVVTATTYANAAGSGADVWEVVPFTEQSLYVQAPAPVGGKPLAASPGAVAKGQTVTYTLPPVVMPNASVYLGLFTPGGDGTGYWGINGDPSIQPPPKLVVTYR